MAVASGIALGGGSSIAGDLDGYAPVDLSKWQTREATSMMALLEPIYRNHPESLEGYPEIEIFMQKEGDSLVATVELNGFLDDSVSGSMHRAIIKRGARGWRLDQLGQKWKCARGANKGWSVRKCS